MIIIDEEIVDLWLGVSEDERARAEEVVERAELVLDYMARGHQVSFRQMPALAGEVLGRVKEILLMDMRVACGARAARAAAIAAQLKATALVARRRAKKRKDVVNGVLAYEVCEAEVQWCAEQVTMFRHSDGGFMRCVVRECFEKNDFTLLCVLSDQILKQHEDEWEGFKELREEIQGEVFKKLAVSKETRRVSREGFKAALIRLFEEKDYNGKPLFMSSSDWVAVFRVAIDVELIDDSAYEDFVKLIKELNLPSLPKPLSKTNVSNAYVGVYTKPVGEWTEEAYQSSRATDGARLKYFRSKQAIARKMMDWLS